MPRTKTKTTTRRKAAPRKRLQASELAQKLVAAVVETNFASGDWRRDSWEPYAKVFNRAKRADRALLRYIARLERAVEVAAR